AKELIANGVQYVAEISNMGCTAEAIAAIQGAGIPFAPGKAVNAGGVATSGLEICQNAAHINWTAPEVDQKLHKIMNDIYDMCVEYGKQADGSINYVKGANIAGFMRVAKAMLAQGII
nr:glutamate dehydrogenase [Bacteroidales bacterium]